MANRGKFITIEGCEGVGKSTHINLLKDYFKEQNIPVIFTREPGGTQISEQIRNILLYPKNKMEALTELLLYSSARSQLVLEVIKPNIEKGINVICDRFIDSTTAYQGYARGIDLTLIDKINKISTLNIEIDATIFLDLDAKKGFERKGGADSTDRMDSESICFHQRVYEGYKKIAKKEKRFIIIDADRERDEVFKEIITALRKKKLF